MNRPSARRPVRPLALTAVLALALTGCGSGLNAQTYQQRTAADATNEAIGALAIRNLMVLPPEEGDVYRSGENARMSIAVISEDTDRDQLTSIRTDAAASATVLVQDEPVDRLVVPPLGVANGTVELNGLTRDLRTGQYITVELTFDNNGRKEMLVPVAVTGRPGPKREGYHPAETDSNGDPIVEEEEASEGSPSSTGESGSGSETESESEGSPSSAGESG